MNKLSDRIKKLAIKLGCDYDTAKFILFEVRKSLDSDQKKN